MTILPYPYAAKATMFGFHTPVKRSETDAAKPPETLAMAGPSRLASEKVTTSQVRRSIGELEAKNQKPPTMIQKTTDEASKSKARTPLTPREETKKTPNQKSRDRLAEAKIWADKAKNALATSRNTKTDIKNDVTHAIDKLVSLIKEASNIKGQTITREAEQMRTIVTDEKKTQIDENLMKKLEEHAKLLNENNAKMEILKEALDKNTEAQEKLSYASVAATPPTRLPTEQTTLHSVVITSKDETESGEDVLNRIRKAVNAKDGGVFVEKIRKAKDRKIIIGCKTNEDRQNLKARINSADDHLTVQETKNKNPLVILKDVLAYNSDEEVLTALRNQNKGIIRDPEDKALKIEVAYKRRTRNPHTNHIVLRVPPCIWKRLVEAEVIQIDLQRVRVLDQSPLVQCSLCLGYGHGKRFCQESTEKCSHCGGPHMRSQCPDWLAGTAPTCCNCLHAKNDKVDHNAFSQDCPIRKRWEGIARATIAYC